MKMLIYSFSILIASGASFQAQSQDLKPDSVMAVLNVHVVNEMGKTNAGDTITFTASSNNEVYSGVTNTEGRFSIKVPNGEILSASYRDMGGEMQSSELELPGDQLLIINWELLFELPRVYTLDNVFFVSGKATLTPASYKELNELSEVMAFKAKMRIEISGHTDNVGSLESNQVLSEARANEVRSYLFKQGTDGRRIEAIGFADTKPIAKNDTPAGRQKNRRTEVRILGKSN